MTQILSDFILILAAAVAVISLFRIFNLPSVIAYLFLGIIIGPIGLGWIESSATVEVLAEIGLAFLLFIVGLEVSFRKLLTMRHKIISLGLAQFLVTAGLFFLVSRVVGLESAAALVVACVLALSSTAIVARQLADEKQLGSAHGRASLSILLFQDIIFAPLLVVFSTFHINNQNPLVEPWLTFLVKASFLCIVIYVVFRFVLQYLIRVLAATRSSELFCLSTLLIALSAAWFSEYLGFSVALGAFVAGLMLGDTPFRHQLSSELRPITQLLLGLFFITIGMLINVNMLPDIWPLVVFTTLGFMALKALVIWFITVYSQYTIAAGLKTGIVLSQGSEFSFALLAVALQNGLVDESVSQVVLHSILVSMILSPIIIRNKDSICECLLRFSGHNRNSDLEVNEAGAEPEFVDHIVLCGFGDVGKAVAAFLEEENIPYYAIDFSPENCASLKSGRVVSGDAQSQVILEAAGLAKAKMMVISFSDVKVTLTVMENARAIRPDLPILVRTIDDSQRETFQKAGAIEAIPGSLETGLMLGAHLLLLLNYPVSSVTHRTRQIRDARYQLFRCLFQRGHHSLIVQEDDKRLSDVVLAPGDHAVGRSLAEIRMESLGVIVTAIRKEKTTIRTRLQKTVLEAGDRVTLFGLPQSVVRARELLTIGQIVVPHTSSVAP